MQGFGVYNAGVNIDQIDSSNGDARFGSAAGAHFLIDAVHGVLQLADAAGDVTVVEDAARQALFLYSGTAGVGALRASLATVGGTDQYGNQYSAGFMSQSGEIDGSNFAQMFDGSLFLGQVLSGSQDVIHAATITQVAASVLLGILSPISATDPSAGEIRLVAGKSSQTTGSVDTPKVLILSGDLSSDADLLVSGSVIKASDAGAPVTWQTPSAAANWTIGSLQYRLDAEDNVVWVGSVTYTGGNVTAAGSSTVTTAVASTYRPKAQWKVPAVHLTSTSVQKNVGASLNVNTSGTLSVQWGDGMAGTTHDVNGLATGDILWFETRVPLGNIT